jgi:hypothetical protein
MVRTTKMATMSLPPMRIPSFGGVVAAATVVAKADGVGYLLARPDPPSNDRKKFRVEAQCPIERILSTPPRPRDSVRF